MEIQSSAVGTPEFKIVCIGYQLASADLGRQKSNKEEEGLIDDTEPKLVFSNLTH